MHREPSPLVQVETPESECSKLTVAVRIRPLLQSELRFGTAETLTVVDSCSVIIRDDHDFLSSNSPNRRHRRSSKDARIFSYDCVFDQNADQETVFERTALPLIDSVLDGFNACVFASGATGSGKTFTMVGEGGIPGIMAFALNELFLRLEKRQNFNVRCSFVEVYNEVIKDLLRDNAVAPMMGALEIREDPTTGFTFIQGVTEVDGIREIGDMMKLLHLGNQRRTTEPTAANETSSRSHAALQVVVEQQLDDGESLISKLSLVDLAGSERAKDTQNRGLRFIEGGNINRSLLALGNCIKALASKDPNPFIPYRDSKLTRLLKDSIGGNCRTVMIANVSPFLFNFTDSLNTLNFANRAKNIKVRVKRNAYYENSESEIRKYVGMIRELESVVDNLQRQLAERPIAQSRSEEYIMYTDDESQGDDSSDSVSSRRVPLSEEWVIKNQLMDNISEQLRIRALLAKVDASLSQDPLNEDLEHEKDHLVSNLQLVTSKSDLLHRSMSNLHKRRRSVTPETTCVSLANVSNTIDECCAISKRILGPRSSFANIASTGPCLIRNKSTRALASPQPAAEDPESKLLKLRDDLLKLEETRPSGKTQYIDLTQPRLSPQRSSGMIRSDSSRRPLKALSLHPNSIPSVSSSSSSARSKSSGPIQFN